MSLDINITERKAIRCPECGAVIGHEDMDCVDSCGRAWYNFLEMVGYYVPYEKRTEENDWYGKDMVLTNKQAIELATFAAENNVYDFNQIRRIVMETLRHGNNVVINADW